LGSSPVVGLYELDRLRWDRRVIASKIARASTTRPDTTAGRMGRPGESVRESAAGLALRVGVGGCALAAELGTGEGAMTGKSPVALPAFMSVLATPFRFGMGPSGRMSGGGMPTSDGFGDDAEVTAVVSVTVGAFHFWVVTMLATAVSFTDVTEVALAATAIWACRTTGFLAKTEPMVHDAVPSPFVQPLVNVGFWLVGRTVSVTDTSEADVFRVETRTT
jgi:hypothetical protein